MTARIDIDASDIATLDLPDREAELAADTMIAKAIELHRGNATGGFCLLVACVAEFAHRTNASTDLIKLAISMLEEWLDEARKETTDAPS